MNLFSTSFRTPNHFISGVVHRIKQEDSPFDVAISSIHFVTEILLPQGINNVRRNHMVSSRRLRSTQRDYGTGSLALIG
jgi:hypothetical protein